MSETAIFIFTKDRPQILWPTLDAVLTTNHSIFLVDDSNKVEHQYTNAGFCELAANSHYLGQQAFENLIASIYGRWSRYPTDIFRNLGHPEWNLGYARNFALQYAKSCDFSRVLFIDDDIIPSVKTVDEVFEALHDYDFAGANITGLTDDSIVGHVTSALNMPQGRMLSGGFLSFKPKKTNFMFLNCYNEDWIWLCLELCNKKCVRKGEVHQQLADPFDGCESKIAFQEFGEVVFDGVSTLGLANNCDLLATESYWQPIITERIGYLNDLEMLAASAHELRYQSILHEAKSVATSLSAKSFAALFENYITSLRSLCSLT
ncbi:MAG: hypothetical protein ABI378_09385 [Chitinophagaceae bacterium]